MVKSEIRHPRSPRQIELESASRVELPRDSSTTDVSTVLISTTREERDPTSVPAESPKTSPSDQTLSVSCPQGWPPLPPDWLPSGPASYGVSKPARPRGKFHKACVCITHKAADSLKIPCNLLPLPILSRVYFLPIYFYNPPTTSHIYLKISIKFYKIMSAQHLWRPSLSNCIQSALACRSKLTN